MANRSTFPTTIDTFMEHFDITPSDLVNVKRYQELKLKSNLTASEQAELQNLTVVLRDKIFTPEDFNKLQDCITNLETFFRDETDVYVTNKQNEMNTTAQNAINTVNVTKDQALLDIEIKKAAVTDHLDTMTAGELRNDLGVMGDLSPNFTNTDPISGRLSLVRACNELESEVGNITNLNTSNKTNCVNAINEINAGSARGNKRYSVDELQNNTTLSAGLITNIGDGLKNPDGSYFKPNGTWWHIINLHHIDNNGFNTQIVVPFDPNESIFYRTANGTWSNWKKIWTESNDGSGSGLDADTVRGYVPVSTSVALSTGTNLNTVTTSGFYRLQFDNTNVPSGVDWGQLIVSRGDDTILQIVTGYNNNQFWMRNGNPQDTGGVGTWGPWCKVWNDQNDGSGSGLDADTVDSIHFQINNDILQYNNGTGWKDVGATASTFETANYKSGGPNINTWYTVVNVAGKGILHRMSASYEDANGGTFDNRHVDVRVTTDGVVRTYDGSDMYTRGLGNKYYNHFFNHVKFNSNLIVEVKQSAQNQNYSNYLTCAVDYGLI